MTTEQLSAASFTSYPAEARAFALEYLQLFQILPVAICPSFLEQVQKLNTLFPAERELLRWQCQSLKELPPKQLTMLLAPLRQITLSESLRREDWVQFPSRFVFEFTAHLWSSSQIDQFRQATSALFAALPTHQDTAKRLVVVILGQGATVDSTRTLRKLRKHGVTLTSVDPKTAFTDLCTALEANIKADDAPYSTWYVDGASLHPELARSLGTGAVKLSYPGLDVVRQRVLERMQTQLSTGAGGPEQMRSHLADTTVGDSQAHVVTADPVLQRFYTELFTQSSGPQIFSTSFVQWTGRELARRAKPKQMVLRYAPRQRRRDMNAMFATDVPELDPQGSLADAEMGTYYTWLEMMRVTAPGKLTLAAWCEAQSLAVILGPNAPTDVVAETPMRFAQAFQNFA